MSAATSGDVSLIKDEDTLRKMWQDTEDFGRKKEIRAHMYKLREARLRDFYNTGEVSTDIKRTSKTTESKSCSGSIHADSLADHSFISMKTKEIRDSESPTKDDLYRVTDKSLSNQGWNISTTNKKSDDGKTFTTSKVATTAGTDKIEGGKIDYAARNEQQASVYKDGDDKNFTKAVGASSNSFIKQEASGGDEHSSFKSSSTKSSSSSKYVSEQRSTSGNVVENYATPSRMITQGQNDDYLVSRKTYTDNIPNELKTHPNYVEGKTKVIRETRTLPDGSTVTTTKYEIRGGNTTQSSKNSQYNEQRSSSSTVRSSQATESRTNQNESKTTQYTSQPTTTATVTKFVYDSGDQASKSSEIRSSQITDSKTHQNESRTTQSKNQNESKSTHYISQPSNITTTVTRQVYDSRDQELQPATTSTITRSVKNQSDLVDSSKSTRVYNSKNEAGENVLTRKTTVVKEVGDFREQPVTSQDSNVRTTTVVRKVYETEPTITRDSNVTTTVVKKVYDSRAEPVVTRDSNVTSTTTVIKNIQEPSTTDFSNTTITRTSDIKNQKQVVDDSKRATTKTTVVYDIIGGAQTADDSRTVTTTVTKQIQDARDDKRQTQEHLTNKMNKHQINEQFITVEQQDTRNRVEPTTSVPKQPRAESPVKQYKPEPARESPEKISKPQEKYEVPERRQPIKPGKSELDQKTKPTDGQYETTYRTDFTNKRISVDVSPTHDAFARSLRAVSPDRITKCSSPSRSLRTSTNSIRSSTSPEKNRHSSRFSPERRSVSPRKTTSHETITRTRTNTDNVNKRNNTTEIDSSTLTRRKNKPKTRSRSPSPTSIASFEFIRNTNIVTDLDTNETVITQSRPSTLEITTRHPKKITDRSPTSPLTDISPRKTTPRTSSLRNISPTKEPTKSEKIYKRTDTYEERCRQILGITNETEKKKKVTDTRRTSGPKTAPEKVSPNKESPSRKSPEKRTNQSPSDIRTRSPEKKSPTKDYSKISEFPSQIKKSPEKQPLQPYPERKSPVKEKPKIGEFPSQRNRSPEKFPLEPYPEKKSPIKQAPKISEFPAQIKKTPEREPLEPYPEKKTPPKDTCKLNEFPAQIRKPTEKEPLEPYPEKKSPVKDGPKINEFPSQIRKVFEKEPLEPYPEKKSPTKDTSKLNEFPSQIRKPTEKEPLEPYPEKKTPSKVSPEINEFPYQTRKVSEKEPLEPYPEKKSPVKDGSKIGEFPAQIRKSPEKEPLEPYPEKTSPVKEPSKINEFPSQIRRLPEKETSGSYPEKDKPEKYTSKIAEFPSQSRRSPEKEPLGPYPEKRRPEFPEQVRKSPERDISSVYVVPSVEKEKFTEQEPMKASKIPEWKPTGQYPKKTTIPERIGKSPDDEDTENIPYDVTNANYPRRQSPEKTRPENEKYPNTSGEVIPDKLIPADVCLFPSRKSPEPSDNNQYPDSEPSTERSHKETDKPSQIRKSPERKPSDKTSKVSESRPQVSEFPSQVRKSTEKEPLQKYPEKTKPKKEGPKIEEFPSQIRKVPEKDTQKTKPKGVATATHEPKKYAKEPSMRSSVKEIKPRHRTQSESSSTTDEEDRVDEVYTATIISELGEQIPVDEPEVTKKFINQLCREEEVQRTDLTKKSTQSVLNKEVLDTGRKVQTKTVKKDAPKKPEELFIEKERVDTTKQFTSAKDTSQTKKQLSEKNNLNIKKVSSTVITSKIDNKTVKKVTEDKSKPKDIKRTSEKITLYDIENLNKTKEDNRVHIRTHRVDDTFGKKVLKTAINGEITKKEPTKRPQFSKPEEPKGKKPTEKVSQYNRPEEPKGKKPFERSPPSKPEEPKTKKPIEKRAQKVGSRTLIETNIKQTTTEQKTPKRHVVTTTITMTPTTRPSPVKQTTPKLTCTVKQSKPGKKKPKVHNGHISSDDESVTENEEITEEILASTKKQKVTRITNDHIIKKKPESKITTRVQSDVTSKTKQEKCITTKSIIINNEATEREVIVDLQRSKSSREPTPDRICPLPVSDDDDSIPRYPDQISEPDDSSLKRKPKKLSDIPILEGEDVVEFSRITEIEDTSETQNDTQETDISLSSINKKITKFSDTRPKVTKPKQGPAPKVERPKLKVTEDLEADECLLSVSEKVNKFITTAEQLTISQDLPQRPKSPKCQYYPEDDVKVADKVAHFITTAEKVITTKKTPAPKVERPTFDNVDERIKKDECLLSVSDKVTKFITSAEKLSDTRKNISLSKIDVKQQESEEPRRRSPSKESTPPKKSTNSVKKESEEPEETRNRSPSKETTPTRKPSNLYSSIKRDTDEHKYPRRDSSPKQPDSTPRSTRRPNEEEPRTVASPTGRLRSTESVKKAKALFENFNKDQQVLKQRDILSRPSVFEGRKIKSETSKRLDYKHDEENKTLKSTKLLLEKARSRSKSPEKVQDFISRRSMSPEGDMPGYMRPLDRSLRPNSPHRENITQINQKHTTVKEDESKDTRHTKFGVTLKRTDSGRNVTSTSTTTTKKQIDVEKITETDVEYIYDLEILEELLEKVVNYELRRTIRTQIRLVKKLISEGKLDEIRKTIITKEKSPERRTQQSHDFVEQKTTQYQSSYAYNERRSSSEYTKTTRRSQSPETKHVRILQRSPSPEIRTTKLRRSQSPNTKPVKRTTETKATREKTPDKSQNKVTKLYQTQLKKTSQTSSKPTSEDNAPEWVKQRNLRKVTDSTVVTSTKSSSTTTKSSTTTSSKKTRSSPVKEVKPIDTITSSYGVGPTDENGSPLFGLKALRVQNKTDKTKVQGTVIRSQYYSENGQEPVGEISVTKYSSDPRDLGRNEDVKTKGVTSITTTQQFGYKDTPSLKTLTNSKKKKEICEKVEDEVATKSTKVTRRGSVKALSQKFIDNAVEISKNERQSSYPKAGLILRTSSFKESGSSGDSREGSAERTTSVKSTTTRTVSGETFLTNRSKVTGVQDVISRMKTEDIREGDTAEDIEARGLLNKFLGAQVILSGIESNAKASTTTTNAKRSTKITTTVTEGGKAVTKTRVFQHPVTDDELETVWDEQTLRLLLEQSTDYEERRKIRARLRQVMAEQEACTELVDKASQDQISATFEGESQLLPLLQGLLEAPDNEQTADSGTESGEDQRNGLIIEVQNALDKLSANLRDDATDITPERRSSLLQLVTKLQAGLATSVPMPERRSSVQGRFRRRQRPDRHTVGVSSEELADARRLIEEISLHEIPRTPRTKISMLQKQNSEGSVGQNTSTSFKPFLPQKSVVKNAIAKPFSSSNSTVSGNSSSVQTPTEPSESLDFLFNEEIQEKKPDLAYRSISLDDQNIRRSSSGDVSVKSIQQTIKQAAARKSTENLLESEETDEDSTVKAQGIKAEEKREPVVEYYREPPPTEIIMKSNPIYQKFSHEEKSNKFSTKKLKMKRANTIDIPKPLNFYEDDADSDCSIPDEDYHQRRRSNYLALRGPIRLGNPGGNRTSLPVFEAKTDNDKKFLAFINKHNENNVEKTELAKNSIWAKPETNRATIWSNKFGNIKTAFEKASTGPIPSQNSARQFWKSADDAVSSGPKYDGPKISKQSARNLRQMFEEKQKQSQNVPWSATTQNDKNIVTGSLKVKAFEPHNEKTYKCVPQPLPVNKFSHAPQSAFKPIQKKAPPPNLQISRTPLKSDDKAKDLDSPLFLYSPPKPSLESSLKPWVSSPGESRVLSLAASKFENVAPPEPVPVKPRRLSKDRVVLSFPQPVPEKLSAPYLVKSVDQKSNTVKQLSGQYNNVSSRPNDSYSTYSTVKYTSPQIEQSPVRHQRERIDHNQNQYNTTSRDKQRDREYIQRQHSGNENQYSTSQQHKSQDEYNQNRAPVQHRNQNHYSATSQQYIPAIPQRSQHYNYDQNYSATSQHYNPQYDYQNRQQLPQTQHYVYPQTPPPKQDPHLQNHAQNYSHVNQNSYYEQEHPQSHVYYNNIHGNQYYEPQRTNHENYIANSRATSVHDFHSQQQPQQQQHQQQQHNEPQYTSTFQYKPQTPPPPPQKASQPKTESVEPKPEMPQIQSHPPKVESQVSVEGVKEYNAVSSRVMTGPVSQQATTIRQKSPMNRDEHEIAAALSLRSALQKVSPRPDSSPQKSQNSSSNGSRKESPQKITSPVVSPSYRPKENERITSPTNYSYRSEESSPNVINYRSENTYPNSSNNYNYKDREEPPKIMSPPNYSYKYKEPPRIVSPSSFSYRPREEPHKSISPHTFSYKSREPVSSSSSNYRSEKRHVPIESLEINDNGESIVTSKFQIPVINVPEPESPRPPNHVQISNKAESWNQICMQKQLPVHKPSPRASPNARTVSKSKSSHSLALPKQFEAGMSKDEMANKRKTMEAFLGAGNKSPQLISRASSNENIASKCENKVTKRSINRLKTSEKISSYRQSSGLSRSRTLPDIACPDLIDETNVDKAFEELFKSST